MVDLNGAMKDSKEDSQANRNIIKKCNSQMRVMTGGGIHINEDVKELLDTGVRKIVVSSNTSKEFLSQIPKDRLIVELSINEEFEVLTEGRKVNTKVLELIGMGVEAFSFTLVKSEGHLAGLDRPALRKLLVEIPRFVKTIIIAGGITSIDDLKFLWSFDRVVPQLGSAIWKGRITPGAILAEAANYD
jgi:phosphoribosylformimino-5-aminoimidazole carboxamide ribonucleotide (ProFAR) isomerase